MAKAGCGYIKTADCMTPTISYDGRQHAAAAQMQRRGSSADAAQHSNARVLAAQMQRNIKLPVSEQRRCSAALN
jgi:hypothetical protein